MKYFLLTLCLFLLAACQLSPQTQEEINRVEAEIVELEEELAITPDQDERRDIYAQIRDRRDYQETVRARDLQDQTDMLWNYVWGALSLGGLGAGRAFFGRSRASGQVADLNLSWEQRHSSVLQENAAMRAEIEALKRGFQAAVVPTLPYGNPYPPTPHPGVPTEVPRAPEAPVAS